MKPIIYTLAATAALIATLACTSPEPESAPALVVVTPNPGNQTDVATVEPTIKPTIPRIQFEQTPQPHQHAQSQARNQPLVPTNTPTAPQTAQVDDQSPAHIGSDDPIARLIPEAPEFDDSVHLSEIYDQVDLSQFALSPDQSINWFQDPNCDYSKSTVSTDIFRLEPYVTENIAGKTAKCTPVGVDLANEPLLGGEPLASQTHTLPLPYRQEHLVLNTSPAEVIAQHPYRFAFKNTHIYAKHRPDPERIKFAANQSASFGGAIRPSNLPSLVAIYDEAGVIQPSSLVGAELWLNNSWYTPIRNMEQGRRYIPKRTGAWHSNSLVLQRQLA